MGNFIRYLNAETRRERERERDVCGCVHTYMGIYIHIYIYNTDKGRDVHAFAIHTDSRLFTM